MRPATLTAGLSALAAGGILLLLLSGGAAVYELRRVVAAQRALAAATRTRDETRTRVRGAEREARAADRAVAQLEALAEGVSADGGPSTDRQASDPNLSGLARQMADARKFLAAFPQARELLASIGKTQLQARFGSFFKSSGLSAMQIQQFEDLELKTWLDNLAIDPDGGIRAARNFASADELRSALGDEGYSEFRNYQRSIAAQSLVTRVDVAAGLASAPLSAGQEAQLAQIVEANSPSYRNSRSVNYASLNWPRVMSQTKSAVSPEQWPAAKSVLTNMQYQQAVSRAQRSGK